MAVRAIITALFALLASIEIVRIAIVSASRERNPALAFRVWPDHPDALAAAAMNGVGIAAARQEPLSTETVSELEQLARVAPLAPEPFLVTAALAEKQAKMTQAQGLLIEARRRDPRNPAARYLLAESYLRSGRIIPGLEEMGVLARLLPGADEQLAPALASYALSPGAVPVLRRILAQNPSVEPSLLAALASDPRNAGLILSLASRRPTPGKKAPEWQEKLLTKLIEKGEYAKARSMWEVLSRVRAPPGIFNSEFRLSSAPPPFNWSLAETGAGVAEPANGGLRVLYFGREDVALASEVLLLGPGSYRLSMTITGELGRGDSLRWNLHCLPADSLLLDLPLTRRANEGILAGDFRVPKGGCTAQRLELRGFSQDLPAPADIRLSGLQLAKVQ